MPMRTFLFSLAFVQAHYYNILPLPKRSVYSQWGAINPSTGPGHERLIKRVITAFCSQALSRAPLRGQVSSFSPLVF